MATASVGRRVLGMMTGTGGGGGAPNSLLPWEALQMTVIGSFSEGVGLVVVEAVLR